MIKHYHLSKDSCSPVDTLFFYPLHIMQSILWSNSNWKKNIKGLFYSWVETKELSVDFAVLFDVFFEEFGDWISWTFLSYLFTYLSLGSVSCFNGGRDGLASSSLSVFLAYSNAEEVGMSVCLAFTSSFCRDMIKKNQFLLLESTYVRAQVAEESCTLAIFLLSGSTFTTLPLVIV